MTTNFWEIVKRHVLSEHTWQPALKDFMCAKCHSKETDNAGVWYSTKGHRMYVPNQFKFQGE